MSEGLEKVWQSAKYAFKPAIKTAAFTFIGIFLPALFGVLNQIVNAVAEGNVEVPGVSTLGQALASAIGAAAAYLVNFTWRFLQQMGLPIGELPQYVKVDNTLPGPVPPTVAEQQPGEPTQLPYPPPDATYPPPAYEEPTPPTSAPPEFIDPDESY